TPAAPAATPKAAPRATVALAARRGATRRLTVRLAARGSVTVTLSARVKQGGKTRMIAAGSARTSFTAAGSKLVAIRLSPAGRRLLASSRRLAVSARVVVTAPGAKTTTRTQRLTLR
ncbi:hypothetical protein Q5424_28445, partial [Conexibacter sp. JD483]